MTLYEHRGRHRVKKVDMRKFAIVAALAVIVSGVTGLPALSNAAPRAASVALGKAVEPFTLPNVNGETDKDFTVGNWKEAKATLIFFFGTRCPVSKAYNSRILDYVDHYGPKGVRVYGIDSNDPESADEVSDYAADHKYTFPTLKDKGNVVADTFGAEVTPEVFLIDSEGKLVYTGQIDDSRDEFRAKKYALKEALDAVLEGRKVENSYVRAFGSTIKRAEN